MGATVTATFVAAIKHTKYATFEATNQGTNSPAVCKSTVDTTNCAAVSESNKTAIGPTFYATNSATIISTKNSAISFSVDETYITAIYATSRSSVFATIFTTKHSSLSSAYSSAIISTL